MNNKIKGTFTKLLLLCLIAALVPSVWAQATKESKDKPAQAAKQKPPPPESVRPFNFPKYQTRKLSNGLTVFAIEDHRQPLVSYELVINAGGIAHPVSKAGLASMTARLLREGTSARSSQDIAEAIDSVGGSLSTGADDDTAQVSATVMKPYEELGMELLGDIVLNPAFKQEELDRQMRQTLSGLQIQYSDPEYLAPVTAARVIFGEHPYGFPVEGTPQSLASIKREDIVAFHRDHYSPAGAFLAVSGDIKPEEAFARAEKYFGKWSTPSSQRAGVATPPTAARKVFVIDKTDAVQTQIVVGELGIRRNDPAYFPLLIANQILGGSFNSRLNMKLRAQEGLTYGVGSNFDTEREAGMFRVSTSTRTPETAKAIRMLLDLLKEFRQNPATEPEIKEAKAYLIGSFALRTETPGQVASRVLTAAVNSLPPDYWDKYRDNIQAVTAEQIAAAVSRHLDPDKVAIIAVGNSKDFAKDLESLGPTRKIVFSDLDLTRPEMERPKETASATTAESLARGKELIQAAVQAIGGAQALNGIKDSITKASVNLSTPQGEMKAEATSTVLYPDKIKLSISLPFGEVVQAFDGKSGWMGQGTQTMEMPPERHSEMARSLLLQAGIGLLREALAGRAEVQALDPVELDGKKMDAGAWKRGEMTIQLLFDPETHLIAKASLRAVTPQGASDIVTLWSDYKEFSGFKVPTKIVTLRNGQKFSETIVQDVKFNTGVEAAAFAKP
ncbi:MAG TPA: pitrilysin family protein [Acidobacteriota bacterium]|nr:pitrilysin family protein [Acidobacteriota bacterium]